MQNILDLTFDFEDGICASIHNGQEAILCSPKSDSKSCWTYNGTLMRPTLALKNAHDRGGVVEAYGKILALAGPNTKVEELAEKSWSNVGDMTLALGRAHKYQSFSVVSMANRVLTFGGFVGGGHDESNNVYQMDLDTYEWSKFRKCSNRTLKLDITL